MTMIIKVVKTVFLVGLTLAASFVPPENSSAEERQYSIEIRHAPVSAVATLLGMMSGKNVVIPATQVAPIVASFKSIGLEDALTNILEANELGFVEEEGVIKVMALDQLQELGEDLITKNIDLKYSVAEDVSGQVQELLSDRGSVISDQRTNSITVRDTEVKLKAISSLVDHVDRSDRQVLIEAKIVDATENFSKTLGIQWGFTRQEGSVFVQGLPAIGTGSQGDPSMFNAPITGTPVGGVAVALGAINGILTDMQIAVAEARGDVTILSRPSIVTLNNQQASIRSGIDIFVKPAGDLNVGGTAGAGIQTITSGIEMNVTPQITVDNKIVLQISVTESQPDFGRQVDGIPALLQNTATTRVVLDDGETTVIGGLFQLTKSRAKQSLPVVSRVPFLGHLFKRTNKQKQKSELIVFIRPTIVKEAVTSLPSYGEHLSDYNQTEKKSQRKTSNHKLRGR